VSAPGRVATLQQEEFHVPTVEELFEWPPLIELELFGIDVSINRVVVLLFVATIIVAALMFMAFGRPKLVPRGLQNFMEVIHDFVRNNIALEVIGREGLPWVPFLMTMFLFIFVNNIFEVIPGIHFPVTSRMAIPAFLAVLVWITFNVVGIKRQGFFTYFKNILAPPGVPKLLIIIPLVPVIEFVSTILVRPLTLSVRLFANMMAGHIILAIFFIATAFFVANPLTIPVAIPTLALAVFLVAFEVLVSVLQAYIFTILTAVYIAGAIHPEH
jgi:F-type H+-transporting ATPase subunit a